MQISVQSVPRSKMDFLIMFFIGFAVGGAIVLLLAWWHFQQHFGFEDDLSKQLFAALNKIESLKASGCPLPKP